MIAFTYRIEETKGGDIALQFALAEEKRTRKETLLANNLGPALQELMTEVMRLHGQGLQIEQAGIAEQAKAIARRHLGGK